ncbi:MAG: hypothetical protein ABUL62_06960 [Myxococcales bacterium]
MNEQYSDGNRAPQHQAISVSVTGVVSWTHIARTLLRRYPRRTALGITLMIAQAFFYNAIFSLMA